MNIQDEKRQTIAGSAAFTGHRNLPDSSVERLEATLIETIRTLHDKGVRTFYCGMAMGFDLMAAECVVYVRQHYGLELHLVACVPFPGQERLYSEEDRFRYRTLLQAADERIVIAERFSRYSYLRRNDYMLEHSATLIACHDPSRPNGGTAYTVRRAKDMKKDVVNLF